MLVDPKVSTLLFIASTSGWTLSGQSALHENILLSVCVLLFMLSCSAVASSSPPPPLHLHTLLPSCVPLPQQPELTRSTLGLSARSSAAAFTAARSMGALPSMGLQGEGSQQHHSAAAAVGDERKQHKHQEVSQNSHLKQICRTSCLCARCLQACLQKKK